MILWNLFNWTKSIEVVGAVANSPFYFLGITRNSQEFKCHDTVHLFDYFIYHVCFCVNKIYLLLLLFIK